MIEQVEVFMRKAFPEEMKNRDEGKCPFCGKVIDPEKEFRDELSKREFKYLAYVKNVRMKYSQNLKNGE